MPVRRIPSTLVLIAAIATLPGGALAGHSVQPGAEALFREAVARLPGGWTATAVTVRSSHVRIDVSGPGGTPADLYLVHPDEAERPVARTTLFAVEAGRRPPPPEVVAAISSGLLAAETSFAWVRTAVTPIHRMNRPRLDLPEALMGARKAALRHLAAGRAREALAIARRLAAHGSPDARAAAAALAGAAQDERCGRVEAMEALLLDGEDPRALGTLPARRRCEPRCVRLFRMKLAAAMDDEDALDRAADRALSARPEDPDVLFLWGTYYYERSRLDEAVAVWDRLAAKDPAYPTFLGQYGTAMLVSGRLETEAIERLLGRAWTDPEDWLAAYLAGLGLYYKQAYQAVIPLLSRAVEAVPETRARMYLAMAHFFAGDTATAHAAMEQLEPEAWQEPDVYYCRSLIYRETDLARAIREMERFLEVFEGESRQRFGQQKVRKARSDLDLMRRGIVPPVQLGPVPPDPPAR